MSGSKDLGCGSHVAEQQPKAPTVVAPAVPVTDRPDPLISRKPPVEHPWRKKNYATKAGIAQAAAHARK